MLRDKILMALKLLCYVGIPLTLFVWGVTYIATTSHSSIDQKIRVIGSSAVFPFAATVAERFAFHQSISTPVVESVGTGIGFKVFCAGSGPRHPDVLTASRPIEENERKMCQAHLTGDLYSLILGYDGIVLTLSNKSSTFSLTPEQIYLALAKKIPVGGKLIKNPAITWKDVDSDLPDIKIRILGPSPTSGTRDTFTQKILRPGCHVVREFFHEDLNCNSIRSDGAYVDIGANENMIIQKVITSPGAIGIVSYSFLDQNRNRVQALPINKILPTVTTIQSKRYILSRPLYIYAKKARENVIPELHSFLEEFTLEQVSGPNGYLVQRGLIPLPPQEHAQQHQLIHGKVPQIYIKGGN